MCLGGFFDAKIIQSEEAKAKQGTRTDLTFTPIGANVDNPIHTDKQLAKMAGVRQV